MAPDHEKSKTQLIQELEEMRRRMAELEASGSELKRTKAALQASEDRFRQIVNDMPVMVDAFDDNFITCFWNHECERVTGYSADEIIGNPDAVTLLYPDNDYRNQMFEEWSARADDYYNWEWDITCKDGTVKTIAWSNISDRVPIPGWRTWGIGVDVTGRRLMEEELRQSEERYRSTLDSMLEGCQIIGGDWRYRYVNDAVVAQGKQSKEQLLGRTMMEVYPGIEHTALFAELERCMKKRIPIQLENEFTFFNGSRSWFELSIQPVPEGLFILSIDITERKRAEQERNITIEFLRLINENSDTQTLVRSATTFFQQQSRCHAVGVRLKNGKDYPYYETRGFPPKFVLAENSLCAKDLDGQLLRDEFGNPVIECMCGNVICGRFDPSEPFFTSHGSFWSNSTTRLLDTTTDADRKSPTPTRNRCNREGYESVALLPLISGDERLGLLQLNDRRKNMFSPERIALWERLAGYLAVALAKSRAVEALRESEDKFKYVFDHSPIGRSLTLPSGELNVNQTFCDMLGYTEEELHQQHFRNLTHPDDIEQSQEVIDSLLSGERTSARFIKRYLHKDGSIIWTDVSTSLRRDTDGAPLYFMTAVNDITARKLAEEKITFLAKFPYENPNPVLRLSADGIVMYANAASDMLLDSWGCKVGESAPQNWRDVVVQALETQENSIIDVQCGAKIYSLFVVPIGEAGYANLYGSDITTRKQAEEERERLMSELSRKNTELEQLVYVTSHDLRSPLVNVQGFSTELQFAIQELRRVFERESMPEKLHQHVMAVIEEDINEALQYILVSIKKMDSLLSGLLKLSRLGRAVLTIETLDMTPLISHVVSTFEFQIQQAGVALEIAPLPQCRGDKEQTNQIFSNLLENALKYLDPDRVGRIHIWGREDPERVVYCVEDNGVGISAEHQHKIFDIFHRLDPGQSQGEGLGLSIVRKVLERQDGTVWVESEYGQGARFFVALPRAQA